MGLERSMALKVPKRTYVTAVSGAIALTLSNTAIWQLLETRVHLSAAGGAGNLTMTNDSGIAATVYDTILVTQDMTAVTDYNYKPEIPHTFWPGDVLKVDWANAGNKTYGIEVIYALV